MKKSRKLKQSKPYSEPLHEKPGFHYALAIVSVLALVLSIYALNSVNNLASLEQQQISVEDFLQKLTANEQMSSFVGVSPLNIVQVNVNNLPNLQAQIANLDTSYIGNFIVQYTDVLVIYDYDSNEIKGTVSLKQQQPQLPADFFTKLNVHPELQDLGAEQPVSGQIDEATLSTLQQQFPQVYENAKAGDFLVRYQARLVIYDYNSDQIINSVSLG
ncbi:hypothetical protein ISS07_06325 [Candidatus Woesearchaeota archaeon]|nr:hypothetical protein [Candidatus Woesearchaeota archaeon]